FQSLFRCNSARFGVSQGDRAYRDTCGERDRAMTPFPLPASSDAQLQPTPGSKDGRGCADHDQPYTFGRRPRGAAPFPFTTRQYARLLTLRGRIADGLASADDLDVEGTGLSRQHPIVAPVATSPRLCYSCTVCGAVVAGAQPEP